MANSTKTVLEVRNGYEIVERNETVKSEIGHTLNVRTFEVGTSKKPKRFLARKLRTVKEANALADDAPFGG
jgi:hypothetical protein